MSMRARFDHAAPGLYLDQQVQAIRTHLPRAISAFDVTAVHQSRVATRRIKAGCELLNLRSDALDRFARSMRDLRRLLGPIRDADVMIDHLNQLDLSTDCAAGVAFVHDVLESGRAHARQHLARALDHADALRITSAWTVLRPQVDRLAGRVKPRLTRRLDELLRTFSGGAGKVTRRVNVDVHQVRIDGKALRYTLEIADLAGMKVAADLARTFKQIQDHLGLWHDLVALSHRAVVASAEHELSLHRPAVQASTASLVRELIDHSERELDAFRLLWRKQGPAVSRAIRAAVHARVIAS